MVHRCEPGLNSSVKPAVAVLAAALLAFLALAPVTNAVAQRSNNPDTQGGAGTEEFYNLDTEDDQRVVFKPPVDGAPGDRIGAGTRSGLDLVRRIVLLAPKGGGLTAKAAPRLFWWLSKDFEGTLELKLEPVDDKQPLLELKQAFSATAGLQAVDLAKLGVTLEPRTIYVWKVILKTGEDMAWTSGLSFVERIEGPAMADAEGPVERARALAAAGIWYDALAEVAIDPRLDQQRASLLESAGFGFVTGQ